jgi:hypothetical protein
MLPLTYIELIDSIRNLSIARSANKLQNSPAIKIEIDAQESKLFADCDLLLTTNSSAFRDLALKSDGIVFNFVITFLLADHKRLEILFSNCTFEFLSSFVTRLVAYNKECAIKSNFFQALVSIIIEAVRAQELSTIQIKQILKPLIFISLQKLRYLKIESLELYCKNIRESLILIGNFNSTNEILTTTLISLLQLVKIDHPVTHPITQTIYCLIAAGASIVAQDNNKDTPLALAIRVSPSILKLMLDSNPDIPITTLESHLSSAIFDNSSYEPHYITQIVETFAIILHHFHKNPTWNSTAFFASILINLKLSGCYIDEEARYANPMLVVTIELLELQRTHDNSLSFEKILDFATDMQNKSVTTLFFLLITNKYLANYLQQNFQFNVFNYLAQRPAICRLLANKYQPNSLYNELNRIPDDSMPPPNLAMIYNRIAAKIRDGKPIFASSSLTHEEIILSIHNDSSSAFAIAIESKNPDFIVLILKIFIPTIFPMELGILSSPAKSAKEALRDSTYSMLAAGVSIYPIIFFLESDKSLSERLFGFELTLRDELREVLHNNRTTNHSNPMVFSDIRSSAIADVTAVDPNPPELTRALLTDSHTP